jgi:hypothetical protein
MMLRARHLLFAWITYGALQLALLGMPGASGQIAVGSRDARSQAAAQSVSIAKRLLAPDLSERRALTPFAPSAHVRLDLPPNGGATDVAPSRRRSFAYEPGALPPARAPPALA